MEIIRLVEGTDLPERPTLGCSRSAPIESPKLDDTPDFGPSGGSVDQVDPGFEFDQSVPESNFP